MPALEDQAVPGACLDASSVPAFGSLYPLGQEFNIDPLGRVGIGTTTPASQLDVAGMVTASAFSLPTGAQEGYVLRCDAQGNAGWAPASSAKLPYFAVHFSVDQALGGQESYLVFDVEDFDSADSFGDGVFRAPVTGVYHFSLTIELAAIVQHPGGGVVWLERSDGLRFIADGWEVAGDTPGQYHRPSGVGGSCLIALNEGDELRVLARPNGCDNSYLDVFRGGLGRNQFSGFLLSQPPQ